MKKLFTFLLLSVSLSCFAQDSLSYKSYRSVWSVAPRFGIGDKQTRANFTTYGSIGLRREFALFKLLSLTATTSYSSAHGRYGNPNLNIVAAGGGITIYPFPLISNIVGKILPTLKRTYPHYNDFYVDIIAEFNFNNTRYGLAGSVSGPRIEASAGRYKLSKTIFLAPKFGFHIYEYKPAGSETIFSQNFFYVGAAFGLNPKRR